MNASIDRRHRTPHTGRFAPVFAVLAGAAATLTLLAVLTATLLALGIAPATGAPGAQDRAGAFFSAAPTCTRAAATESACTRPASTGSTAGFVVGCCVAAKGETTLYRAVSDAELDDIAKNGLRVDPSGRGYQTEKLFTGSAKDAARQAQIAHRLSGQVSTIIEARFPSSVDILAGRADSMDIFSVGAGNLGRGRVTAVHNYSPIP